MGATSPQQQDRRPRILHLDLDAFFAAVEQRDKPSLRGKPVVVGGLGPRGVVATASYEARRFGVRSAMRMAEARARCPHAAFLAGRFSVYRLTSGKVMGALRELSPAVEQVSLDEAYVDLGAAREIDLAPDALVRLAHGLKQRVREVSGGLTASIGIGTSKLIAKIASDLDKPNGLVVVEPGQELDLLHPLPVSRLPGVGPATRERLRRIGVQTVSDLAHVSESELTALLGKAHGHALAALARAEDDRPVVAERDSKSISIEDTFDQDIADRSILEMIVTRLAREVCERLNRERLSGRTVTVKIRLFDFTTYTRSATLAGPTDDPRTVTELARRLLHEVDTSAGVRLLGVGVSGLAGWTQETLFTTEAVQSVREPAADSATGSVVATGDGGFEPVGSTGLAGTARPSLDAHGDAATTEVAHTLDASSAPVTRAGGPGDHAQRWVPGADVVHARHGRGWVWGAGLGRVTVRFETATTGVGMVRTFAADDPELGLYTPLTWTE
ncbi:MAG TPA: DNA polymerase IV [Actinopolymorphaceae bacterium]